MVLRILHGWRLLHPWRFRPSLHFGGQRACVMLLLLALSFALPGHADKPATKNGFDLEDASIPVSEIVSGGPPRDGIPAINDPKMVPAAEAGFMKDEDRIIGINLAGEARAYPIKILDWHEVVNDSIGDQYYAVTYCPLCGSGIVFASNAGDGRLVFGISGLLYNSDVLLFDRNTESLWSQLMAEAVSGKLKGLKLPEIPAFYTSWRAWQEQHPETLVLSTDTGYSRNYNRSPYIDYPKTRKLFFDVSHQAPRYFHAKQHVLGVKLDGITKAYAFSKLSEQGLGEFEDQVGDQTITVSWNEDSQTAFANDDEGNLLPTTIAYWFAWYTFNPNTLVFGISDES